MIDINRVVLIGRLTRDAELKVTSGGQAVCKFSIAVNRRRKNGDQWEDEANFFDIVVWGRQGESIHQYLIKGKMIAVDGELRQDRWEKDGQKHSKVEIVAGNLQLLGGNPGGAAGGYNGSAGAPQERYNRQGQSGGIPADGGPSDGFADDIPF
jgi:single-strand DNA-binding protein